MSHHYHVLEEPNSAHKHSTHPGSSTEARNIYTDSDKEEDSGHPSLVDASGIQYTEPVSAGIQSPSESFTFPPAQVQGNKYVDSDPHTEVIETTGRIYHLLDVSIIKACINGCQNHNYLG